MAKGKMQVRFTAEEKQMVEKLNEEMVPAAKIAEQLNEKFHNNTSIRKAQSVYYMLKAMKKSTETSAN
ncbi:hypothetical protein ACP26L_15555 [Paenibacillus sp. S-38]|uniref:hypothetical protein n=1 Tax=Paenibacillus sp. S-38 TaxID=3416710 RepID=UPI003CF1E52E